MTLTRVNMTENKPPGSERVRLLNTVDLDDEDEDDLRSGERLSGSLAHPDHRFQEVSPIRMVAVSKSLISG